MKKSKRINEIKNMFGDHLDLIVENVDTKSLTELRATLSGITDERHQSYVKYNLMDIVMIVLLAVLSGADEWIEIEKFAKAKKEWLSKIFYLPYTTPSHDTIQRVFSKINTDVLHNICINYLLEKMNELFEISQKVSNEKVEIEKEIRQIDGKCSVGSHKNKTATDEIKAIHTLNMYSEDCEMCVSQIFVEEKSNEIPASREIMDIINIEDCIITCDALNTQKSVVDKIIKNKGQYVCALKGNQHNFFKDVEAYFEDDVLLNLKKNSTTYYKKSTKENSNIITRMHYIETNIDWLYKKEEWSGIKAIGLVHKIIQKPNGITVEEKRYYICSIENIYDFARCTRCHWSIENKLHWHLDYTFKDDKNTTVEKNSAKNLQIIKKIALSLLNLVKTVYKTSLKNIRKMLGWDYENQIDNIFKLINTNGIESLLLK
ncbi:MAG: ISAs1 family transposase [Clostridia bacterium]